MKTKSKKKEAREYYNICFIHASRDWCLNYEEWASRDCHRYGHQILKKCAACGVFFN